MSSPGSSQQQQQSITLDSIPENVNQHHPQHPGSNSKNRLNHVQQQQHKQQQHLRATATSRRTTQSASTSNNSSGLAVGGMKFIIADDTPRGHGKRMKIVPGIEIYDEDETTSEEEDTFIDDGDDYDDDDDDDDDFYDPAAVGVQNEEKKN
jgi:hypothetical protein